LRFQSTGYTTDPAVIADKLKGAVSADNAPVKVDFRGCSVGTSPKAMNQIRSALGARSAIGGTCYAVIMYTKPIKIDDKEITRASDITDENRKVFEKTKKQAIDELGAAKKCILNPKDKGFFAMGGRFVTLWFNRKHTKKWIPKESVCYKDIKPQIVDDPDKALSESQDCRLIEVQEPEPPCSDLSCL
jgi:hypothetical protein